MGENRQTYAVAASRITIVAGIFSVTLAALLLVNHFWMYPELANPKLRILEAEELVQLKKELRAKPADAELVAKIRAKDQQERKSYFQQRQLTDRGNVLLTGGMFVFIAALQVSLFLRRPRFRNPELSRQPQDPAEAWSRKTLAVSGTALVLSSLMVAYVWGAKPVWKETTQPPAESSATGGGAAAVAIAPLPTPEELAQNWGRFRGATGQGIANFPGIPETGDTASGKNVLWKTEIPLPGENSPVVWGNRVFVTGATKDAREVFCFDADSGALLWREPVSTPEGAKEKEPKIMDDTGYAASTAATDGRRVVASFANGEIAAFNFQGKRLWARHLGTPDNSYGHATSLALWRDRVIVLFDQGDAEKNLSKILALNSATGEPVWSTPRPVNESWSTPLVVPSPAGDQIVTTANPWVIAYNPENGKELWKIKDIIGGEVAPSPTFSGDHIFVGNDGACLASLGLDGKVAWKWDEGALPDICSLLSDNTRVYILVNGTLTALNAATGKMLWEKDFEADIKASPCLVNGKIWVLTAKGVLILGLADDTGFKETGRFEVGEEFTASPAFAPGRVYLRGKQHLFGFGEKASAQAK